MLIEKQIRAGAGATYTSGAFSRQKCPSPRAVG